MLIYPSQDPDLEEVLQLAVSVTCASPPHNRVLSCSSCQAREVSEVLPAHTIGGLNNLNRPNEWLRSSPLGSDQRARIQTQAKAMERGQGGSTMKTRRISSSSTALRSSTSLQALWSFLYASLATVAIIEKKSDSTFISP